jgi:hypothetical protein
MGTAGVDVRTIFRQVTGLIREHKDALTIEYPKKRSGIPLSQVAGAFRLRDCLFL